MNTFDLYSGKNSVYNAMKSWAGLVYPPKEGLEKYQSTSNPAVQYLLNIICGSPCGITRQVRIFHRVLVANLLAEVLSGKREITMEEARKLQDYDNSIWKSSETQKLLN